MRVGFTGTRKGMTDAQKEAVRGLLARLRPAECHHGDCIGADAEFYALAEQAGALLVIHPPTDESQRAFCQGDRLRPAKDHLARNRQIVDETEALIGQDYTLAVLGILHTAFAAGAGEGSFRFKDYEAVRRHFAAAGIRTSLAVAEEE